MEVLLVLAERPREVVEREELLRRVWGSRAAVSDEPLTRCIAELRRALGDSRETPTYIQTIPKRGYRLLVPVTPSVTAEPQRPAAPPAAGTSPAPPQPSRGVRRDVLVGCAVLLIAVVAALTWYDANREVEDAGPIGLNTIAVLPFDDDDDSADAAYLGEGMAEEILNRLSEVNGLRVTARTS
jgi:DNA-binding winged helix-turn-helix (wHTH) protein